MVDAVAEGLEACGGVPTTRGAGQEGGGRRNKEARRPQGRQRPVRQGDSEPQALVWEWASRSRGQAPKAES